MQSKPIPHFSPAVMRTIFALVSQNASGCWEWQGAKDPAGYGTVTVEYTPYRVHRVFYQQLVEELRQGLVIDHLCRNPSCCNPLHLEQVEGAENTLRGESNAANNARKIACIRGHRFTRANTYIDANGWRQCKLCNQERKRATRRRSSFCRNGHERTPENTRYRAQGETCRICQKASEDRYTERRRAKLAAKEGASL